MIMLTLVCGKFPWRRASFDEYYYRIYVGNDEDVLFSMFDITYEFNTILKGVFTVNPTKRVSLSTLRKQLLGLRSFGPGSERQNKPVADTRRVPVFIDLPDSVANGQPLEPTLAPPVLSGETAIERSHPMFAPPQHQHVSPIPPALLPESSEPEFEFEFEKEARTRRRSLQAILELLEATLPSVPKSKGRPPFVSRPTRELQSCSESDEGEPTTPETHAADAARDVAVMDVDEPPLDLDTIPEPMTKRNKSEVLSSVVNAKRKLRDMMHTMRMRAFRSN